MRGGPALAAFEARPRGFRRHVPRLAGWVALATALIVPPALRAQAGAASPAARDGLGLMTDQETFQVGDFSGEEHQRPEMGCELSDFGSWYDAAYSGGVNRLWINSVREHTYDQVGFNTTQDVGLVALFLRTPSGRVIDGSRGDCRVEWYPYGWTARTVEGNLRIESTVAFIRFNTLALITDIANRGERDAEFEPAVLVADRSEYDGMKGGLIVGMSDHGRVAWRNRRVGRSSDPNDYTDSLRIGSSLGALRVAFLRAALTTARGDGLEKALRLSWTSALSASAGSAVAEAGSIRLAPGGHRTFAFYVAAGADDRAAEEAAVRAEVDFATAGCGGVLRRVREDWGGYLAGLPKLKDPTPDQLKLYYASALALRTNRVILRRPPPEAWAGGSGEAIMPATAGSACLGKGAVSYSASFPGRGAFNLFFQSDACWNVLGYLDVNADWAEGHAVPMLVPPSIIMDPHFFWSIWEIYSRLPDAGRQKALAARVYPLLERAYRTWTTRIDVDHNLLCSTPNNWDDSPRADLLFREAADVPGQWNSWWTDWVNFSRDRFLEDPAASSQLAYGTVVLARLARILGRPAEAAAWERRFQRHVKAVDTLWDEQKGYWIVTYRHSLKDAVLTSSIIYPIFTDVCRDPARIRRVIEQHLLNPREFNGRYPVPTVAYDDPRYYHQKPPRADQPGGLWRGNIWMPEAWIVVKGLYKYGYQAEAESMAGRLVAMMAGQGPFTRDHPQFACVPAEYYDSRTGEGRNNRRFSWSSAVAMEFLLGNYQNERVLGANPDRDRAVDGHVREIFDFGTGLSLFRVRTQKRVFPVLHMKSTDGRPIEASSAVAFVFEDPAGNFEGGSVAFTADARRWSVRDAAGKAVVPGPDGFCSAAFGEWLALIRRD